MFLHNPDLVAGQKIVQITLTCKLDFSTVSVAKGSLGIQFYYCNNVIKLYCKHTNNTKARGRACGKEQYGI